MPRHVMAELALAAAERETLETFELQRIRDVAPLWGTYPPDEATRRAFVERRSQRERG